MFCFVSDKYSSEKEHIKKAIQDLKENIQEEFVGRDGSTNSSNIATKLFCRPQKSSASHLYHQYQCEEFLSCQGGVEAQSVEEVRKYRV